MTITRTPVANFVDLDGTTNPNNIILSSPASWEKLAGIYLDIDDWINDHPAATLDVWRQYEVDGISGRAENPITYTAGTDNPLISIRDHEGDEVFIVKVQSSVASTSRIWYRYVRYEEI